MRSLPIAFGKAVRRLREGRGTSQERFAGLAGLSRTYMSEVERGVTSVSLQTVHQIARALDMSMSELLKHVEETR